MYVHDNMDMYMYMYMYTCKVLVHGVSVHVVMYVCVYSMLAYVCMHVHIL